MYIHEKYLLGNCQNGQTSVKQTPRVYSSLGN